MLQNNRIRQKEFMAILKIVYTKAINDMSSSSSISFSSSSFSSN